MQITIKQVFLLDSPLRVGDCWMEINHNYYDDLCKRACALLTVRTNDH